MGVLIGLMLLIYELSQNTEMMRAQIHQSRTDSALTQQHAMFNSHFMPDIIVKVRSGQELSPAESIRYSSYFRATHRNQDNALWQYRQGLLTENTPGSVRGAVRTSIGGRKYDIELWDRTKDGYTDEYVAFVEEAIKDLR